MQEWKLEIVKELDKKSEELKEIKEKVKSNF